MRLWQLDSAQGLLLPVSALPSLPVAVTAMAWCPGGLLALGREDGLVELHRVRLVQQAGGLWVLEGAARTWCSPAWCRHVAAVQRLAWRAVAGGWQLATCADDHAVMVFSHQETQS